MRLDKIREHLGRCSVNRNERAVRLGELGLQSVSRFLRFRARIDRSAHFMEKGFDGPERCAFNQPLQPTVRRKRFCSLDGCIERQCTFFIIGSDVEQPRCKSAPTATRAALWSNDPAPELNRLLPAK